MFVAVRAIAPVAAMPPKSGLTMLAMPCAMSSWLESCRSSIIPSATTAHSRDSIAASSAMVVAGWNRCWMFSHDSAGMCGCGSACGMPPNLLPMVSTCKPGKIITAAVPRTSATMEPGTRRCHFFGQNRMIASEPAARFRTFSPAALRIVDKMPDNYLYLGLLASLFPRAKFIHCRRDLRDVAVSCWMTQFREVRWANDQQHIASRFHQYQRMMEHWRKVLPVPLLEVDYEETVADLEGVARKLVAWCGLEWDPSAWNSTRRSGLSVRPARSRSASRSIAHRWEDGSTTNTPWLRCSPVGKHGAVRPQALNLSLIGASIARTSRTRATLWQRFPKHWRSRSSTIRAVGCKLPSRSIGRFSRSSRIKPTRWHLFGVINAPGGQARGCRRVHRSRPRGKAQLGRLGQANLGNALREQAERLRRSNRPSCRRALELKPDLAEAHSIWAMR